MSVGKILGGGGEKGLHKQCEFFFCGKVADGGRENQLKSQKDGFTREKKMGVARKMGTQGTGIVNVLVFQTKEKGRDGRGRKESSTRGVK